MTSLRKDPQSWLQARRLVFTTTVCCSTLAAMQGNLRKLIIPAVVVGVLLLVIAVIYFAEPQHSLPSFFPGHASTGTHHHTKHGIAALILAIACFAFAWFQTGPKAGPARSQA